MQCPLLFARKHDERPVFDRISWFNVCPCTLAWIASAMAVCGKNGFFAKLFDEAAYSDAYAAIIQTGGWRGTLWIPLCMRATCRRRWKRSSCTSAWRTIMCWEQVEKKKCHDHWASFSWTCFVDVRQNFNA